jgi:hypothetical protein
MDLLNSAVEQRVADELVGAESACRDIDCSRIIGTAYFLHGPCLQRTQVSLIFGEIGLS